MAVQFDDLIPNAAAPAAGGEIAFDDLIPARREPELRAYNPSIRDRIASTIMGDSRPDDFRGRLAKMLVGSTGVGTENISAGDLFPPTGVAFAGDEAVRAAGEGRPGAAALHAIGVIPAPGVGPVAKVVPRVASNVSQELAQAGERLNVALPRASVSEGIPGRVADVAKEVPTIAANPIREASDRALAELDTAIAAVQAKAAGRTGNANPMIAAREGFEDWIMGRGASAAAAPAEAIQETNALRATLGTDVPAAPRFDPHGPTSVITPDQSMSIRATPELVELDQLSLAAGKLQPRDRTRAEYQTEVLERARQLDPQQLMPARLADAGAPIIMPDGTILSGNGRVLSIAEVYANPALRAQADAYRLALGPEAANMRQPVLVMRSEAMTPEDASRFADLSNRSRIASMSATERAGRDAGALGNEGIALYRGGDFETPENAAFLRAFMDRSVTAAERPSVSMNGRLTQEGVARMRAAVLHGAYEDATMLSRMLESTDDNIRNLTNALADAAPGFAQLRADIRAGIANAEMDATPQLTEAVRMIADLRSRGVSPAEHFGQIDAFSRTDPLAEAWVRAFYNDDLTRPISRQKMADVLNAYSTEARKHAPGGLLEDPTTAGDVLNVANRAKGPTVDEPQSLISGVPPPVGQGVSDSGAALRGQGPAAVSGAAPEGSAGRIGDAGEANARNASQATAGPPVISSEKSHEIITRSLIAARQEALAKALGVETSSLSPERTIARIAEMAMSRKPADITGLIQARKLMGDKVWADHVGPQVLHSLGGGRLFQHTLPPNSRMAPDTWDVSKFSSAWENMTNSARDALFRSSKRRGLRDDLDALATLGGKVDRLKELSASELERLVGKLPLVGGLARFSIKGWVGQMLSHAGLTAATGGAHIPVALATQPSAYAVSWLLSRPVTAQKTVKWVESFERLIGRESGNANSAFFPRHLLSNSTSAQRSALNERRETALFLIATRNLATAIATETGGDVDSIENRLLDPRNLRLGSLGGDPANASTERGQDDPPFAATVEHTRGGWVPPGRLRHPDEDIESTTRNLRNRVGVAADEIEASLPAPQNRDEPQEARVGRFAQSQIRPAPRNEDRIEPDRFAGRMNLGGPVPEPEGRYTPLGRLEQLDSGNFYRNAAGDLVAVNPRTDILNERDGMVYAINDQPLNPEAARAAEGVNVFGKVAGAMGMDDDEGTRARTSWRDAVRNTFASMSMANALQGGVNAADRLLTERGGRQDPTAPMLGFEVAGTVGGTGVSSSLATGGPPSGALMVFAGPKAANRLAKKGWPQPKAALELAADLFEQGKTPNLVFAETSRMLEGTPFAGVTRTADGQLRFEISDETLVVRTSSGRGRGVRDLGGHRDRAEFYNDLIDHPILATAYPEFKKILANIADDHAGREFGNFGVIFGEDPKGNMVAGDALFVRGPTPTSRQSVTLHELDHFAQSQEGFPGGGSTATIGPTDHNRYLPPSLSLGQGPEWSREAGKVVSLPKPGRMATQDIHYMIKLANMRNQLKPDVPVERAREYLHERIIDETAKQEHANANYIYTRLGGEESARETQSRMHMTAAQRRENPPNMRADSIAGGIIPRLGQTEKSAGNFRIKPDRDTIMQMPQTREIADKLHERLSKSAKGKTDAEIWEMAYDTAVAEMERRIDKGGLSKFTKVRRADNKVPNREQGYRRLIARRRRENNR